MPNAPDKIILHCSATEDTTFGVGDFDRIGYADIDRWHRDRGWAQCGYHFIIRRSGVIEIGRPVSVRGAHTAGYNEGSIGVCYVGTREPTAAQMRELLNLYVMIKRSHKLGFDRWFGHRDFNHYKSCPGFSTAVLREVLRWYDYAMFGGSALVWPGGSASTSIRENPT
jgi:hypothetical protein